MIEKRLSSTVEIMLQVNTSKEEQKGGFIEEDEVIEAVHYINKTCKMVQFGGLMTIGSAENSKKAAETGEDNPDFTCLSELQKAVAEKCEISRELIPLSMGMSTDYVQAIRQGADVVRVGSKIFGARDYSK